MFLKGHRIQKAKVIELPLPENIVKKTKQKLTDNKKLDEDNKSKKQSKQVKTDSNIQFEISQKTKPKPNGQPEHLRKALEARRARLAEEKAQGIKPIKKEKKKKIESDDSDSSLSSLDMNKIILKTNPKKYFSDSE